MMSINVTELLVKTLENACKDLVNRAVTECATKYHFDAHDAMAHLGTEKIALHAKKMIRGPVSKDKPSKDDIPMPFMADHVNHDNCQGLRFNHGLFTQCTTKKMNASQFCKNCQMDADKNASAEPTCGTVQKRIAMADNFVDSKGRKPKNYALLLKKMKIDVENAIRFAQGKNIDITPLLATQDKNKDKNKNKNKKTTSNDNETETKKRGRPRKQPMQVEAVTDMFALYQEPQPIETLSETPSVPSETPITHDTLKLNTDEKALKKADFQAKKEQDKKDKEAKKLQEKAEKEAKKLQEKAEKEAKKKTKDTNNANTTSDTNNANITSDTNNANITQQVAHTIIQAQTQTKTIKVDGQVYTLHIHNNHVYDLDNNHVGNFDPIEKAIEFFDQQDEDDDDDEELQEEEIDM